MKRLLLTTLTLLCSITSAAEELTLATAKQLVAELYQQDIRDAESFPSSYNPEVTIEVKFVQLDEDDEYELLARLKHPFFCGYAGKGCKTVLLNEKQNGWHSLLGSMNTHGDITVHETKTYGFYDINFGDGPTLVFSNDRYRFVER